MNNNDPIYKKGSKILPLLPFIVLLLVYHVEQRLKYF